MNTAAEAPASAVVRNGVKLKIKDSLTKSYTPSRLGFMRYKMWWDRMRVFKKPVFPLCSWRAMG